MSVASRDHAVCGASYSQLIVAFSSPSRNPVGRSPVLGCSGAGAPGSKRGRNPTPVGIASSLRPATVAPGPRRDRRPTPGRLLAARRRLPGRYRYQSGRVRAFVGVVGPEPLDFRRLPDPRRARGDGAQSGSGQARPASVPALGKDSGRSRTSAPPHHDCGPAGRGGRFKSRCVPVRPPPEKRVPADPGGDRPVSRHLLPLGLVRAAARHRPRELGALPGAAPPAPRSDPGL